MASLKVLREYDELVSSMLRSADEGGDHGARHHQHRPPRHEHARHHRRRLLKRVREDHDHIPLLTIAYEGQQDTQTVTRLEAFMHQARAYREARKAQPVVS